MSSAYKRYTQIGQRGDVAYIPSDAQAAIFCAKIAGRVNVHHPS